MSHASPAAQANALASPWANRAASRSQIDSANPNVSVVAAITPRPASTVGLTPKRAAAKPAGSPATSTPSGYAAASTPASAFVRSSSSA